MSDEEQYLVSIVSPLTGSPDEVKTDRSTDEKGVLLGLRLSGKDMPHIIGKGGRTIKAIRDILHIYGSHRKMSISIKIYEPNAA